MPRQSRIDFPGALHHVIGRGMKRKYIFQKEEDKGEFFRRFRNIVLESGAQCSAWCIMNNHFHILLQIGQIPLSTIMRRVLTGYAFYFNKKYKRTGHLFQNRYKSIICDNEEYYLPLVRYIHLNPVRARIIKYEKLCDDKWTGHYELLKGQKKILIEKEEVLSHFGKTKKKAKAQYIKFIEEGLELKESLSGGGLIKSAGGLRKLLKSGKKNREMHDDRILGSGDFVSKILRIMDNKEPLKINLGKIENFDILLAKLADMYAVDKTLLRTSRIKEVREARSLFVYVGHHYMGKSLTEVGQYLGITQSAASIARKKGCEVVKNKNVLESLTN